MSALITDDKPGYNFDRLVLSYSSLNTFHSCPRKFEFRAMFGDTADREETFAAEVGHAIHAGYEQFLVSRNLPAYEREREALVAMMKRYPYALEASTKGSASRSLEACYATLAQMFACEQLADWEIVYLRGPDGVERAAIEVPFAMEITGSDFPKPVYYVGFIDCVIYNRNTQKFGVVDIKSTRRYLKDASARYEFDEQCIPYAIILEHLLGQEIKALDVIYLSAFVDMDKPEIQRYEFYKPADYVADWHRGLCSDIDRMTQFYNAQWWQRASNGDHCVPFGRKCFFSDYCSTRDPVTVNKMLRATKRELLFSSGAEPWVSVQLPYAKPFN